MTSAQDYFRPALRGMKANLLPGLVLQGFALLILLSYFCIESVGGWLDELGAVKERIGYLFAAVSTAIFGGVVPLGVLVLTGKVKRKHILPHLLFYGGFWLWKGVEIDAFYRAQAFWFGDAATPRVIATKTIVDQFIYNPLWAAPTQTIFFLWKDCGFSLLETQRRLQERSLLRRSVVVLVSTWAVWVPAVMIIYTLPSALQLPLSNLVLCFWCLLLSFVSVDESTVLSHKAAEGAAGEFSSVEK